MFASIRPPSFPSGPAFVRWLVLGVALAARAPAAEPPAPVGEALHRYNPDPPIGWAYSVAVHRGTRESIESFDPTRPAGQRWTLQKVDGRPPTPQESDRYARYRETTDTGNGARATFVRGDLDLNSVREVANEPGSVSFHCSFRPEAPEPVLAHLDLQLVVGRDPARVRRSVLRLVAPYSPIFGVTMKSLVVETVYASPPGENLDFPALRISRFEGRVLGFWPIEESVETRYLSFHRVTPGGATQ
ncbi:MAG TPA: hypothetical protein VGM73_08745 [Candidatus Didemnitutus sp.]